MNCGIMIVGNGIMIAASSERKIAFLKGSRIFANAKAASAENPVPMTVTVTETMRLVAMPEASGPASHTRTKLSHWIGSGIHCRGSVSAADLDFSAVLSVHTSGAIITIPPRESTIVRITFVRR